MASQMATPSYTPEVHEDVDFMFMFMSQQNNDVVTGAATQEQQYMLATPAQPAETMNAYDPHLFGSVATPVMHHTFDKTERLDAAASAASTVTLTPSRPTTASSTVTTPSLKPVTVIQTSPPTGMVESASGSGHNSPVPSDVTSETAPLAHASRRKRKLTPEDKRRICEIYRTSQGKIRQEDIAKEYSVDRSTISKILNQEERWLDPDAPGATMLSRRPGGRYPAIEGEMHRWLDEAVMHGREVRDSEAREEALRIGLRLGHPHFQASSKWWDGVKRRRVEEGRPLPTARRHAITPPMGMTSLSRSYSAMGMDPYGREFAVGVAGPGQHPYALIPTHMQGMPMPIRGRSQSSPQVVPNNFQPSAAAYASQPSLFGPAPRQRFSPGRNLNGAALRQWQFPNGTPARPLSRGGSSHGQLVGQSLAASAFGMTATELAPPAEIGGDAMSAPALSQTSGMSPGSVILSDASDVSVGTTLSPETPRTPSQPTLVNIPMSFTNECGVDYTNPFAQFQPGVYPQPAACLPETQYMTQSQVFYPGYIQPQW